MNQWQQRINGFISPSEQQTLKNKTVFVPGCGAIGSYAINMLARTGIGNLIIADFDSYQIQNMPGQLFCQHNSLNKNKAKVAAEWVNSINPDCQIKVYGKEWMDESNLKQILTSSDLLLLGFDTLSPGILLYRSAPQYSLPIVDFYYGTLLSCFVTFPGEPTPEQRLNYPTLNHDWQQADNPELAGASLMQLTAFVLSNCPWILDDISSDALHRFLSLGKIAVLPSLVAMAGTCMADAALETLLDRPRYQDYKGFFYDWRRGVHITPKDPDENAGGFSEAFDRLSGLIAKAQLKPTG